MNVNANYMADSLEIKEGKVQLIGSQCRKCNNSYFPSRDYCTECIGVSEMDLIKLGPKGVLYSYTMVHVAPPDFDPPYVVGYVDFPENVRVLGQIEIANDQFKELRTGMEVSVSIGLIRKEKNENPSVYSYKFIPNT
jgi:uncharacterized protein